MRPVTISQTGVGNSVPVPVDIYLKPFNITIAVEVTGTVTYSVVWTTDNVFDPTVTPQYFAAAANLTGASTNQAGSLISPVTAIQLQVTAGTGTATMRIIQAGMLG